MADETTECLEATVLMGAFALLEAAELRTRQKAEEFLLKEMVYRETNEDM